MDLVARKHRLIEERMLMVMVAEVRRLSQRNGRWSCHFAADWRCLARRNQPLRFPHLRYPHQESEP